MSRNPDASAANESGATFASTFAQERWQGRLRRQLDSQPSPQRSATNRRADAGDESS